MLTLIRRKQMFPSLLTTPEDRVALAQAAEFWRRFTARMRRGLTLAQTLPEPSRMSLQALRARYVLDFRAALRRRRRSSRS